MPRTTNIVRMGVLAAALVAVTSATAPAQAASSDGCENGGFRLVNPPPEPPSRNRGRTGSAPRSPPRSSAARSPSAAATPSSTCAPSTSPC